MQLTSLSLALTRAGLGGFSPSSLFLYGEQGVWYEPSLTNGTCFQDAAGTTPVTAVEQPVGLILDKSKGLVLGSPLSISGWTNYGSPPSYETFTTSGSSITSAANTASTGYAYTNKLNLVSGRFYRLDITVGVVSGSAPQISTGNNGVSNNIGSLLNTQLINGDRSIYFRYNGDGNDHLWIFSAAAASFSLSISVRELPGNHAYQTTSTSRPVLSSRYNLLTKTEQFDDANWQKQNTTVVANAIAAPGGDLTADKLNETAISGIHAVFAAASIPANIATRISVAIKAAERTFALVGDGTDAVTVNLTTGVAALAAGTAIANVASASLGDGWFRVSYTITKTVASDVYIYSSVDGVHANRSFVGTAGSGIYIWGAQLTPANQASIPYQRVNTATDYDADPAKFKPYLKFDGVDDFLVTNSIDFTATDKMTVFAGVRKLSDAAAGILVELSATLASNNGVFALQAPNSAVNTYRAESKGTAIASANALGFSAPVTSVVTTTNAISADAVAIRVNGSLSSSSATDQGTGNYGNYPLYIGRRGGTALPFNGYLYSLIVRGAQTSDTQVSQTETWVNGRTGAWS